MFQRQHAVLAVPLLDVLVISLISLLSMGCERHLFSPPARVLPLETPQTLAPGQSAVQVEGSGGGAVFGPRLASGTLRARHGVADDLDVVGEATVIHVSGSDGAEDVRAHPNIYAVRSGLKYRILPCLAVGAGVGGGGHAGGGFVSPDASIVIGWENRWVVPFIALRGFSSHPIGARDVYLGSNVSGHPRLTLGFAWAVGLRLPLLHAKDGKTVAPASVTIAVGANDLRDGHQRIAYGALALGLEMVF